MALNNNGLNQMLSGLTGSVAYVSLHTTEPNSSGSNEVVGGSYTRESVTWAAASAGSISASNSPVFDVPGSTTVAWVGLWSAVSSGTYYGALELTNPETFGSAGTLTMDEITVTVANAA